jgi:hypothetical protein
VGIKCKVFFTALGFILLAGMARAQFIGYTSAQSVTSTPFSNVTCTAALLAGSVKVTNLGQGAHSANVVSFSGVNLTYTIRGSFDGSTFFDISDVGTGPVNGSDITGVTGSGYYPVVAVQVSSCAPASATLTIQYSAISLTPGAQVGTNQTGQISKHIAEGGAANAGFTSAQFRTPFGSTGGMIAFAYSAGGPAGSTITINCGPSLLYPGPVIWTATLATALGQQQFNVPNFACPLVSVNYNSGGASAVSYTLDYAFSPPGNTPSSTRYADITTNTNTQVKTGPGFLHTIMISNPGSAEILTIFDGASCAGTKIGTTSALAAVQESLLYDVQFFTGLCITSAGTTAGDFTVSFQ